MSAAAETAPTLAQDAETRAIDGEAAQHPAGVWRCPVELVLQSSQSAYVSLIRKRHASGDRYQPTAVVFAQGGRLFARVFFYGPNRPELLFALDAWLDPQPQPFGRRGGPC